MAWETFAQTRTMPRVGFGLHAWMQVNAEKQILIANNVFLMPLNTSDILKPMLH
jgi:hypothetical protein